LEVELTRIGYVEPDAEYAAEVRVLLSDAFPDGAPNELDQYYARYGTPTASLLLRRGQRVIGHLAIFQRRIRIGNDDVEAALLGEIAIAADCRGMGLARGLVQQAHEYLREHSVPFSILFAFEPRVYESSGYKPMRNLTRFRDADGEWKTLVYRGGMYAELLGQAWPNLPTDLCGPAV
jgi:predicted acetyltransferase